MSRYVRIAAAIVTAAALGGLGACTGGASPGSRSTSASGAALSTTAPATATPSGAATSGSSPTDGGVGGATDPSGALNAAIDQTLAAADTGLTVQIASATTMAGAPAVTCQTSQYQFNEDTGTLVQFQVATASVPDSYATNLPQACANQAAVTSDIRVLGTQAWAMAGSADAYTPGELTPDAATDVAAITLDPAIYRVMAGEVAQVTPTGMDTYESVISDMSQVPMSIAFFAPDALGEFGEERDTSMYTGIAEHLTITLADGKLATIAVAVPGSNDATGDDFAEYVMFTYGAEPTVAAPTSVTGDSPVEVTSYDDLMDLAS